MTRTEVEITAYEATQKQARRRQVKKPERVLRVKVRGRVRVK
jgi:hypothetical protein